MKSDLSQQNPSSPQSPGSRTSSKNIQRKSSPYKALIYKSIALQRKSVATNFCQIITPLLCVGFTLLVQILVNERVVTKIGSLPYPQPFNLPGLIQLIPQFNSTCNQFYFYNKSESVNPADVNTLLQKVLSNYCPDAPHKVAPYFQQHSDLNNIIIDKILEADAQTFHRGQDIQGHIPDGAIYFKNLSREQLSATIYTNDHRLPEYHRSNGITKLVIKPPNSTADKNVITSYLRVTEGQMSIVDLISKAYLNTYAPNQILMSSFMYMPFSGEDRSLLNRIINVIGSGLYPLGLSFLLPVFIYAIVSERQERLLEMMKTNGLKLFDYWIITFGYNFTLTTCTFGLFYVTGRYVLKLSYFTETSAFLMFTVMLGWGLAQISLANFIQVFMNKAKTATIIGYVIAIFTTLAGQAAAAAIFPAPLQMPKCTYLAFTFYLYNKLLVITIYPTFALCRVFYLMSFACSNGSCFQSIHHIDDEMKWCIQVLYSTFLLFPLSIYLNEIVKQDIGASKHPLFFLQSLKNKLNKNAEQSSFSENSLNTQHNISIQGSEPEDEGVRAQKAKVERWTTEASYYPLVIRNIHKKYQLSNGRTDYTAVKPISFTIKNKQIFGLLGPNGAGKTSLISVLTGMYSPTSGDAFIDGCSIHDQMDRIRMAIGVCPQFDLLWRDLSPQEHLEFYGRLKGINENDLPSFVNEALEEVDLRAFKHHASHKLSGGMKRRLSIAIALVGNPSLVFLDQPSSGLDPQHRRSLWNILIKCKSKRSVLLTTHSMQEADVLCNRIGIITQGTLRCVGNQTELKLRYGSGYNLTFNLQKCQDEKVLKERVQKLKSFVQSNIVIQADAIEFNERVVYKLNKQDNKISRVFRVLNQHKQDLFVEDWALSQPSLYDVFIKIVSEEKQETVLEERRLSDEEMHSLTLTE